MNEVSEVSIDQVYMERAFSEGEIVGNAHKEIIEEMIVIMRGKLLKTRGVGYILAFPEGAPVREVFVFYKKIAFIN